MLVGLNLVYGSWSYDRAVAKIEKGMTRAHKRSSAKHTFYLICV